MKKVLIIGGGFAGLTSAAYLSNSGFKVELIEASKKLGGRAYSLIDKESGSVIDNGQHILMGCYTETLKFLNLIGAKKNLIFQSDLEVNFLKENNQLFPLKASPLFYPFNLLFGLLNYKALTLSERLKLLKFFFKIYFYSESELKKLTVYQWLLLERQTENIIKSFWEILAVGALNTNLKKASAKIFSDVLKEIFFSGKAAAAIILPKDGLTETYCDNAVTLIKNSGGEIITGETVKKFEYSSNKIFKIITDQREIENFDYVISAVPHFAIKKVMPELFSNNFEFEYSGILTVHLWLKENNLAKKFYGLINSKVHWIFNHDKHITLVTSDANDLMDLSHEEIYEMVLKELEKFAGINKDDIRSYKIIKEKRSTFIPSNQIESERPSSNTKYKNFFLAGDWTDTGLPSTIESASKSGRIAAQNIISIEKV
jgi:hydroxysqualene dehydroxylase